MFGLGAALHVYAARFVEWPTLWSERRAYIIDTLTHSPGKHLILVRGPKGEHNRRNDEWVYNRADIDGAKIVWARELDSGSNARLLAYFRDRSPFLLEVDKKAWRIGPLVKQPRP